MSPYVTHPLLAVAGVLILAGVFQAGFTLAGIETVPVWGLVLTIPALVMATLYFGREAGQTEHDLKNRGWGGVSAYLGAILTFGWSGANFAQFAVAAVAVIALAGLGAVLHAWGF